jgi:hypothetical protein
LEEAGLSQSLKFVNANVANCPGKTEEKLLFAVPSIKSVCKKGD